MKRRNLLSLLLLTLCTALALCACGGKTDQPKAPYLKPTQLTEEETSLAKLLGAERLEYLYDFTVDDTAQSLHLQMYHLVDGKWEPLTQHSGLRLPGKSGRILLEIDDFSDGYQRFAIQCDDDSNSCSAERHLPPPEPTEAEDLLALGFAAVASRLSMPKEIVYEEEIPVAIQLFSNQNPVYSPDLNDFDHPEVFDVPGNKEVYAMTLRFSQKPLA